MNQKDLLKMKDYPIFLTPAQRVKYQKEVWGISTTVGTLAVLRHYRKGVRYTRIDNRVFYKRTDIDEYFQNQKYFEVEEE